MEKLLSTSRRIEIVKENCKIIQERVAETAIKSGRAPEDVRLMAVTKTVEPVLINTALEQGIDLIGENRVQEFLSKRVWKSTSSVTCKKTRCAKLSAR